MNDNNTDLKCPCCGELLAVKTTRTLYPGGDIKIVTEILKIDQIPISASSTNNCLHGIDHRKDVK